MATAEEIRATLDSGDMQGAAALLDAQLAIADDPELRLARGRLAYLFADFDGARRHLEGALETFRARGDPARAALAASWLGRMFFDGLGNQVAGRAWLARARRLAAGLDPCVEQGWVALSTVGCSVASATDLEADAHFALDIARRFGDVDLEAKALADYGLALVSEGRVAEGMESIDEAMAVSTGERVDPIVTSQVVCCLFTACERTGDLARVEAWMEILTDAGMFGIGGSPVTLAHCSGVCGLLLTEVGRWNDAEDVLDRGVEAAQNALYFSRLGAQVALAELRLRQGRLDEAEQLLLGHDHRAEALRSWARLHLARGDFELAAAVAQRGLRLLSGDRVRAVALLAVVVEAELALGNTGAANAAAGELERLAAELGTANVVAEAAYARARVEAADGDVDPAITRLCSALARMGDAELPLTQAKLHMELARLQAGTDRTAAEADARAVASIHARLGAPIAAADAGVLRQLGVAGGAQAAGSGPARLREASLARDGGWWTVGDGTTTSRLRDTKGLRYLAELVAHPHVERHVLDLVDVVEGTPTEAGLQRRQLGDAGELLDAAAKASYRRRIEDLRQEVDAALAVEDDERAAKADAEIDALVAELSRAVGLGGRDRRAASAAERARLNVTRALRTAIARIAEVSPAAAGVLDRRIRTGIFCAYEPAPDDEAVWTVGRATSSPPS